MKSRRGIISVIIIITVENMVNYDVVFIGYSAWWHATLAFINTVIEIYDFTGKLEIPFFTRIYSDIDEMMPIFFTPTRESLFMGRDEFQV